MIRERLRPAPSGWPVLWVLLAVCGFSGYAALSSLVRGIATWGLGWGLVFVAGLVALCGFFVVNPNEGRVLLLIRAEPRISTRILAERIGVSTTAIDKTLAKLKERAVLRRVGPARGGYWAIVEGHDE